MTGSAWSDYDSKIYNRYGILHSTAHTGPEKRYIPSLRGRKNQWRVTRSGLINIEGTVKVYGITGTSGYVRIHDKDWVRHDISEPGGVCESFEVICRAPLECEVLGMTNAIVNVELIGD